jgi:hypothetical protein
MIIRFFAFNFLLSLLPVTREDAETIIKYYVIYADI